jgi:hypothetical protein
MQSLVIHICTIKYAQCVTFSGATTFFDKLSLGLGTRKAFKEGLAVLFDKKGIFTSTRRSPVFDYSFFVYMSRVPILDAGVK